MELEQTITAGDGTLDGWSQTEVGGPPAASEEPQLHVGMRLGRYVLTGRLGEGGMGVVYAAYDPELDRGVALKLLAGTGRSEAARLRMLREAQAMARLQHPNVVTVHDVGAVGDQVYVAMEQVRGVTLRQWLAQEPRAWQRVLEVMRAVARGLIAAHAAGLVHRDVKPENVMIGDDGRVRVMDFGLARADGSAVEVEVGASSASSLLDSELTHAGAVVGTPHYMAPEGLLGGVIAARADQFSWCVTCLEALDGRRPFDGEDLEGLRRNIVSGKLPAPPPGSRVPGAVRRVIMRGLDVDAARRHKSMAALLAALDVVERRRRWRFAGYVAVLLGLGVGVAIGWQRLVAAATAERCAAAGAIIDATWGEAQAGRVAEAFAATGQADAAEVFTRTRPWLDEYAAGWASARTELCMASSGRTPTLQEDLAAECLEDRRAGLSALVDGVLVRADASTLARAVILASRLAPISGCADPDWLARESRPPTDPEARVRARGVRSGLERVAILTRAARYEEAARENGVLLAEAEALAWPPLVLSALAQRGSLEALMAKHAASEATLEGVVWRAEEAGNDRMVADVASDLIFTVGVNLGRPDDGLRWGRFTLAVLRRIGEDESLGASDTYAALGILQESRGEFAEAQRLKEKVLALRERHLGPDNPAVATAHDMLGVVLMERGELAAALAAHQRGLEIRLATLGPGHLEVGNSYVNTGNVRALLRQPAVALELQEKARAIFVARLGPEHPTTAVAIENAAVCRFMLGDYAAALASHREALAIRERAFAEVHPHLAASHLGIGDVLRRQGDLAGAAEAFARSQTICEASQGAEHPNVALALRKQGEVRLALADPAGALVLLERAWAIREARELPAAAAAAIDFRLGQALWESGRDRERGRGLILAATPTLLADDPEAIDPDTREVRAWYAAHTVELMPLR